MTRPDRPAQSGIRDGLDPQQLEADADWGSGGDETALMLPPPVSIARSLITSWAVARTRPLEWSVWPI